jgi:retron-type reverse transcriptase
MSTYSRTRFRKIARPGVGAGDYYRRRRQLRALGQMDPSGPTLARVADPEHLIATFYAMKAKAGSAPGPDRVTFEVLGPSEVAACLRAVSRAILDGNYAPGPSRKLPIPKPGGGHRTLTIRNLIDRIVSKAIYLSLLPVFERIFLDGSHGFRPGRSNLTHLAALEAMMIQTGRTVLAQDDVKKAFDHVVIADVMEDLSEHITDTGLLTLIEAVIRGGEHKGRAVGIAQGDPLSPLLLNVRLHHIHDSPMTGTVNSNNSDSHGIGAVNHDNFGAPRNGAAEHTTIDDSWTRSADHANPDTPDTGAVTHPLWLRYADNLVFAARSVTEGAQILDQTRRFLEQAGHTLKGENGPPVDLRTGEAQLLGFTLSLRENRLHLGLGEASWRQLARDLEQAHDTAGAPTVAHRLVEGWLTCFGATFESSGTSDLERVYRIAAAQGFRELTAPEALRERINGSRRRWRALCRRAHQRHLQGYPTGTPPIRAAPPAPATPGG